MFAKFFPTAPSVLQQKKGRSKTAQERKQVASAALGVAPDTAPAPKPTTHFSSKATAAGGEADFITIVNGDANIAELTSVTQDENEHAQGDLLNGVGSASSTSTASSVFSATNHSHTMANYGGAQSFLTPLTATDSSPGAKTLSPPPVNLFRPKSPPEVMSTRLVGAIERAPASPTVTTLLNTPPPSRSIARPSQGEVKGSKAVYDPDLDKKLSSKEKRSRKVQYRDFGEEEEDAPPPDPRLAIANYTRGTANKQKQKLRIAPYTLKPYPYDAATSVGPGPPTRVVVTGFDPLIPVSQITSLFSSFGDIAEANNKTDPVTGSFLGVCLIRYRDSRSVRGGPPVSAINAAKRAYGECRKGQRIGVHTIRAELDRDGSVCKRAMDKVKEKQRAEQAPKDELKTVEVVNKPEPPPTAPKGPSGKSSVRQLPPPPPEGPRAVIRPVAKSLVEEKLILEQIKRDPYIFIAHCYVPVLSTTIPHLKKRLKAFSWKDVRCDKTGYYVTFDDSRRGEEEAARCFGMCHMTQLFTYIMNMECQQYGNPNYERSPSPERLKVEQREKAERERLRKEEELDMEEEKKQRAQNLDPSREVMEIVRRELRNKLLEDVKSRIAGPALYDFLDPDRHMAKRRKLGIADPGDGKRPGIYLERADDTPPLGTPDSRADFSGSGRRPLAASTLNVTALPRIRKGVGQKRENIGFTDERRKQRAPKKIDIRPLHHRLHQFHDDEDSDDDERTSLTRDTEDQDSRPISRMSMSSAMSDNEGDPTATARKKRQRTQEHKLSSWGGISDDEDMSDFIAAGIGTGERVADDTVIDELERNINKLAPTSRKRKRLVKELAARKKQKEDDELFGIGKEDMDLMSSSEIDKDISVADVKLLDDESVADLALKGASETPDVEPEMGKAKLKKPKAKRKTKKQVFEEREAMKKQEARAQFDAMLAEAPKTEDIEEIEEPTSLELPVEEPRAEVEWG
ncbi:MAG: histone methyltransferase set1, partial [Pleopsidium flavum]